MEYKQWNNIEEDNFNNGLSSYIQSQGGVGWHLYRIPLLDFIETGDVDFSEIQNMRIWVSTDNVSVNNVIKIAKIELVGNEWEQIGLIDNNEIGNMSYDGTYIDSEESLDVTENITIEVINNEDNSEYISPDGVSGEYNEYEGRMQKEQALSINFTEQLNNEGGIEGRNSFFINKPTTYGTMTSDKKNSFFNYKYLEMFVNGIPENNNWVANENADFCIRLGREDNYYEIRQPFQYGNSAVWDSVT